MASLELIDEITDEICKVRGIDLPRVCIKIIVLSYIMYCMNTYDVKYQNEMGQLIRLNGGCLILCQKGSGKSRTLKFLKQIFSCINDERQRRYKAFEKHRIGMLLAKSLPLTKEEIAEREDFYHKYGRQAVNDFDDPITQKALCEVYGMMKEYSVNNILFTIDEVGDRMIKEYCGKNPSLSAKDFMQSLNQLFDGYCAMGQSSTSRKEEITSQYGIGANFIFVSTAEFLKDFNVQQRYKEVLEAGLGRRLLYVNCPPIDQVNVNRKRVPTDFNRFVMPITNMFDANSKWYRGRGIPASEELWQNALEKNGAGAGLTMGEEFLLLLFSTVLAAWTLEEQIKLYHWQYMVNVYKEMQALTMEVIQKDTTSYDKICNFIKERLAEKSNRKKIPVALVKDYCARNHLCYENQFKKWFAGILTDFANTNLSKYIIERNQTHVWLSENYAYEG